MLLLLSTAQLSEAVMVDMVTGGSDHESRQSKILPTQILRKPAKSTQSLTTLKKTIPVKECLTPRHTSSTSRSWKDSGVENIPRQLSPRCMFPVSLSFRWLISPLFHILNRLYQLYGERMIVLQFQNSHYSTRILPVAQSTILSMVSLV